MELTGEIYMEYTYFLSRLTMTGHSGEIFATRFDPTAHSIASGSMDRNISESQNLSFQNTAY